LASLECDADNLGVEAIGVADVLVFLIGDDPLRLGEEPVDQGIACRSAPSLAELDVDDAQLETRSSLPLVLFEMERDELSEDEMMTLAMGGGAVSPVTSYLAIEPGVRPSTEGLEWGRMGGSGARAPSIRMGATSVSGRRPMIDKEAHLQDELRRALRSCGIKAGVSATFESNRAEIALLVRDEWQKRGIGSFLLKYLITIARRNGIGGFTAEVLRENKPAQSLLQRSGLKMKSVLSEGIYTFELDFD